MADVSSREATQVSQSVHLYSERAVLHQRDVVASSELWHHDTPQRAHAHEFMEIVSVRTGTALHRMRTGVAPIATGSVLMIRPGQWHAYDDPCDFSIWNLYIPYKTLDKELTALRSHPVVAALMSARAAHGGLAPREAAQRGPASAFDVAPPTVDLARLEPLLAQLSRPPERPDRSLTRLGQLLMVLDELAHAFRAGPTGSSNTPTHPAVIAATELLDNAPNRAWTLRELADGVHVSTSYLCRLFTRELGISPLHYVERHRLEHTAQLLLEGDLSVGEISVTTGWSDSNYMSRRFRSTFGMSPTRYRQVFQSRRRWAAGALPLGGSHGS